MIRLIHLICLMLALPVAAMAEREVHVVSIANGVRDQADLMSIHEAHVHVSRPGQSVVLVLVDRGPVTWRVTFDADTVIEDVWMGGDAPTESDLFLGDNLFDGAVVEDLPVVLAPDGNRFRNLIATVTERAGVEQITSFYGAYDAPQSGIRVDKSEDTARYAVTYLERQIGPLEDLPDAVTDWTPSAPREPDVRLTPDGFELNFAGVKQVFDVPPDMPEINLPMAATLSADGRTAYGMTLGGVGYIYQMNIRTGEWSILRDQEEFDGAQIFYDWVWEQLIMTGAFSRPGEFRIVPLEGEPRGFTLPVQEFAGLTDLYDYGNEDPPSLVPRFVAEGWLVLTAGIPGQGAYRVYAVHLETHEIRLLAFHNPA